MKDDNKSLFLYTGLIFLVALIIILLSFFGQAKFDKKILPEGTAPTGWGIDKKVAVISDENRVLTEKNAELTAELEEKNKQLEELTALNTSQTELMNNYNIILNCYTLYRDRKYTEAKELSGTVNTAILSPEVSELYNELLKEIEEKIK